MYCLHLNVVLFSYIVYTRKGYQQFQEPRGSSVIKVKGVARVVPTDNSTMRISGIFIQSLTDRERLVFLYTFLEDAAQSLWDASEYGIPPLVCIFLHFILKLINHVDYRKKMHFS
jgi:hypothetical protein